ncbi:MAG: hypothetical protein KGO02_12410, partial [Alphaproteobacteria bacterium]|nr:hypothetical protein [Alphaproteobacteria bacterium]
MEPQPTSQANATPTPAVGAAILIILIVAGVSFIYVNSLLGLTDFWAGFLFLTYWMAAEQVQPGSFTSSAVGAVIGLLVALGLQVLPHLYGNAGEAAAVVIMLAAIYMQIVGWGKLAFNFSTMIFLTAGAAVPMQLHTDVVNALKSLVLGIVFFGAVVMSAQKLAARH